MFGAAVVGRVYRASKEDFSADGNEGMAHGSARLILDNVPFGFGNCLVFIRTMSCLAGNYGIYTASAVRVCQLRGTFFFDVYCGGENVSCLGCQLDRDVAGMLGNSFNPYSICVL